MKGKDWKFKKFIPDKDDIDASYYALSEFLRLNNKYMTKMNDGEFKVHLFNVGFSRGAAWMRDKLKGDE